MRNLTASKKLFTCKTFLLALKGLELKDLFTELRFEISSFAGPVKNLISPKHHCNVLLWGLGKMCKPFRTFNSFSNSNLQPANYTPWFNFPLFSIIISAGYFGASLDYWPLNGGSICTSASRVTMIICFIDLLTNFICQTVFFSD